jgi:methionine-rich copper-binding protein CopC
MKAAASALGVLLTVLALTAAPTASAHATRIRTDPAVGAVLATGRSQVSATFNEHLQTTFSAMTVVGPDGNLWSTGQPRVQSAVISVDVMPLGPAGTYTVNYRVTSADGHVVSGSWPFLAIGAVLAVGAGWWAPPQGKRLNPGNSAAFHVRSEFDVVDGEPAPAAEPYGELGCRTCAACCRRSTRPDASVAEIAM